MFKINIFFYQCLCAGLSLALHSATALKFSVGESSADGAGETSNCQCTAEQSPRLVVYKEYSKWYSIQILFFEHQIFIPVDLEIAP